MPSLTQTHGTTITLLTLLHSLSASTKLSVVAPPAGNATSTPATTLPDAGHSRRRSKFYSDSSHEQPSWQNRQLHQQVFNPWPEYNYHDYRQVTSLPDLTTIVYPRFTTEHLRHTYAGLRPPVAKLKPYQQSFPDPDDDEHQPLAAWYPPAYKWPAALPSSVHVIPVGHAEPSFGDDRASSFEHYYSALGHPAPVIYHHHHEETSGLLSKLNLKHIGIAALVKLALAKLKIFVMLKLLFLILLKFKLLLLLLFLKFAYFLKALKVLKALLVPLLLLLALPLLLPLLLLPLLLPTFLARYLLPLLLLLPTTGATNKRRNKANGQLMESQSRRSDLVGNVMSHLMEAEACVQLIACQLATRKESSVLDPLIRWYLNKMRILKQERMVSHLEVYIKSSEAYKKLKGWENADSQQWCRQKYSCDNSKSQSQVNNQHESFNVTTTDTTTPEV